MQIHAFVDNVWCSELINRIALGHKNKNKNGHNNLNVVIQNAPVAEC